MTWVVVPAAGRGVRAGGDIPKQYQLLLGQPMIEHTLRRLASHPRISGIIAALAPDDPHWPDWDELEGKPVIATIGGIQRSDSVLAGLNALPDDVSDEDFVLVHDAARPIIRHADISALLDADAPHGALLAVPLADTLKQADKRQRSSRTVPRSGLWRALTPQMFRRAALAKALHFTFGDHVIITDEAMAMERAGFSPTLVEGAADNLKVTTPQDFRLAEFLLQQPGLSA